MSKLTKIIIVAVVALGIIGAIKMNSNQDGLPAGSDQSSVLVGEGTLSPNFCHNGFSNVASFIKDGSGAISGCDLVSCSGGNQSFSFSGDPLSGCTGDLEDKLSCVIDKCVGSNNGWQLKGLGCSANYNADNSACTVNCPGTVNDVTYNVSNDQFTQIESECNSYTSIGESGIAQCIAGGCSTVNNGIISGGGVGNVSGGDGSVIKDDADSEDTSSNQR